MARNNKSFFERLTGTINLNSNKSGRYDNRLEGPSRERQEQQHHGQHNEFEDEFTHQEHHTQENTQMQDASWDEAIEGEEDSEGELAVDVYETPDSIVVQTMAAGVRPKDLDVSITRETCTVSGRRQPPEEVPAEDYFHEELYWGPFSRTVTLPTEVEVEEAQANEKHGLLTITLPKVNEDREMKLEIN